MKLPRIAMVFPCERRMRGEKSVIPWEYTLKESLFFRWIDFESLVKLSNSHCVLPLNNNKNTLLVQYTLDLRKPDLRKNLDLRKIVVTTDFLVCT